MPNYGVIRSVASLGLASPGAATEKLTTFFSHHRLSVLQCHPYFFLINWRFFLLITVTFIAFHSGVTPWRVSPRAFFTCQPHLSTVLCKFSHNFFPLSVTTGGCHPGRSDGNVSTPFGTLAIHDRSVKNLRRCPRETPPSGELNKHKRGSRI